MQKGDDTEGNGLEGDHNRQHPGENFPVWDK